MPSECPHPAVRRVGRGEAGAVRVDLDCVECDETVSEDVTVDRGRGLATDGGEVIGEITHALTADLNFDTDGWEVEGAEYEEEFRDAVETVREDHDEEVLIDADDLYYLKVRWNDGTEEVRFDVFAVSEVFAVGDADADDEEGSE